MRLTTAVFALTLMAASVSTNQLNTSKEEDFPSSGVAAAIFTWVDHILIWTMPVTSVCLPAVAWSLDFLFRASSPTTTPTVANWLWSMHSCKLERGALAASRTMTFIQTCTNGVSIATLLALWSG